MKRQAEPELMEDSAQVYAYAQADFSAPHTEFINRLRAFINTPSFNGLVLDLGCGPGDISLKFALAFPNSTIHAIDGSKAMIDYAQTLLINNNVQLEFIHGKLPEATLPFSAYDLIFSNSLLHHLAEPMTLWHTIKRYAKPGASIMLMDLLRPNSTTAAQTLVETYATNEPELLKRDFYHSLLAAYTQTEVQQQLVSAQLNFNVEQISDRHLLVTGLMPS